MSGTEGEDVELECLLSKPNVKVRWMKNRKPLTPSDRIKIVCDRYRHMLRIMETIPEDEGEYTIVLPNDKESSAHLTIYGKVLSLGKKWRMCCEERMLGDLEFGILAKVFIRVQFVVVAVSLEVEQTSKKQPPKKPN